MKSAILAFTLLVVVAADVSHLKNVYLPPVPAAVVHTQHYAHVQKSQDFAPVPVQEVVDNSVTEYVAPQEEQGQVVVETAQYDNGVQDQAHVVAQHVANVADISNQVQAHAQQALVSAVAAVEPVAPVVPSSEVYQNSNQQQAVYYTQPQQQQPQQYYTSTVVQQPQIVYVRVPVHQHVQNQHYQKIASHVQHHAAVSSAPVVQAYAQQQNTGYYGQQSASAGSAAAAGTGTQYAANGGYVY